MRKWKAWCHLVVRLAAHVVHLVVQLTVVLVEPTLTALVAELRAQLLYVGTVDFVVARVFGISWRHATIRAVVLALFYNHDGEKQI